MKKMIIILLVLILTPSFSKAENCPEKFGKYGNGISYQNIACRFFISADKTDAKSYRSLTFTDAGLIQVFSNFPGTTNSNSTGARVYYLFPLKNKKEINEVNQTHLSLTHPSGVEFDFNKAGRVSSPDIKMQVSSDINSHNKGGVEILSYSKGIVIDLGYRMGNSPTLNKNAIVTVKDKNSKQCTFLNSEFHKIGKYDAELIYKTNEELYGFLSKKCKGLDLSDLLGPIAEKIKVIDQPRKLGNAPLNKGHPDVLDSAGRARVEKERQEDSENISSGHQNADQK